MIGRVTSRYSDGSLLLFSIGVCASVGLAQVEKHTHIHTYTHTQAHRSLYAECVGHQVPGGGPKKKLRFVKKEKRNIYIIELQKYIN